MKNKILKAIIHPRLAIEWLLEKSHILNCLSDEKYLKFIWRLKNGNKLNLDNPQTYNEKLQWLKLYNRNPIYTQIVDKISVKYYVRNLIGDKYIIPTLAVWDSPEKIEIEKLPDKFVLKANNGSSSSGVIICKDKMKFNLKEAKKKLSLAFKGNVYKDTREWPYKDVIPKIFAEKYMEESDGELRDYKFFCFNGKVKALFIATERFSDEVKFDYFDEDFNHLDLYQVHPMSKKEINIPDEFEKMKEIASKLSKGFPHVRVDLYNVNGKIYFGEITFFHHGGFAPWHPEKWNLIFGSWLKLPERREY